MRTTPDPHHSNRAALALALLSCLAALSAPVSFTAYAELRSEQLTIKRATVGPVAIGIEVAETQQQKAMGLMFRRELAPGRGMLFPYDPPHDITMWMRNTYISLDMIFIRGDGVVHRIEARTEPMSETVIRAGAPVTAVLEIAGGEAARLGIKPGDTVVHSHFKASAR